MMIAPISFAGPNASTWEDDQAYYQNTRSTLFNEQNDVLNDQGYIDDMEESEVQDPGKYNVPLKAKGTDCKETAQHTEECKDIVITN